MTLAIRKTLFLAGTALVALPAFALAEPPAALDRVPTDVVMAVGVRSIETFDARLGKLFDDLKLGQDGEMAEARKLMKTPGLNPKGSVAIAIFADPKDGIKAAAKDAKGKAAKGKAAEEQDEDMMDEEGNEPPMVIIVPVTDYNVFVKHFGAAEGAKGVVELTPPADAEAFQGEMYAKDIGGGYAALSPKKDIVEKFEGKGGNMAEHAKALGKIGNRISDSAETIIVANIATLAPKIREGVKKAKDQMSQMAGMGGQAGNIEGAQRLMEVVSEGFLKDAQIGIVGLGLDEGGVWIDIGAQFKDGSEVGNFFKGNGNASSLVAKLPDQPFLLALGYDTSDAGIKKLVKNAWELMKPKEDDANDALGMMASMVTQIDKLGGMSMVIGQSPGGITGGLLSNSSMFISSSDPASYVAMTKGMLTSMNGKTIAGSTYQSTYEVGVLDIGGTKVDKYSTIATIDPNAENAMQLQQAQMMMFGPAGGASGYSAIVDKGIVTTMSPSKTLMTAALESAKGNKALGVNKDLQAVAARLPANRSFETYIGIKSILEMAAPFLGGGKPMPATLPPIGLGATTNDSGTHLRIFVPTAVIATMKDTFGGQDEEPEAAPAEKSDKPPRF